MPYKDYITIVSGLPRSGTSMMMKMLQAGGMEILSDNIRKPDNNNPNGYFEFEAVKNLKNDNLWLVNAKGKAFKATFNFLKDLPQGLNYKIIFMERNFDEIIASQNKMLLDLGKKSKVAAETIKIVFHEEIIRIKRWLTFKKISR